MPHLAVTDVAQGLGGLLTENGPFVPSAQGGMSRRADASLQCIDLQVFVCRALPQPHRLDAARQCGLPRAARLCRLQVRHAPELAVPPFDHC